jgi:hypothetical protein
MSIYTLPTSSKIWIYPAKRNFTPEEEIFVSNILNSFISSWQSHGTPVVGAFEILQNRFIVIAADQHFTLPSGCSIDSSVAAIRQIEEKLNVGLLERGNLSYIKNNKIETIAFDAIKPTIHKEELTPNTIIFNNNIEQLEQLENQWQVLASNSWLNRLFVKTKME